MILLTGFDPFTTGQGLRLEHNPTAGIAERVAARLDGVEAATLPVSFTRTRESLLALFETHRPEAWIGMGFAPHRVTLDIETLAVNVEHATSPDNDGETPWRRPVVSGAPAAYPTRLDVEGAIQRFSDHGVEAHAAFHAGTFLCNQSFYLGCHAAETPGALSLAAFIHVPPMDSFDAFERGLQSVVMSLQNRTT